MTNHDNDIEKRMREFARSTDGSIQRIEEGVQRASASQRPRRARFLRSPLLKVAAIIVVAAAILFAVSLRDRLPDAGVVLAKMNKRLESVESTIYRWERYRHVGANSGVQYISASEGQRTDYFRDGERVIQTFWIYPDMSYYTVNRVSGVYYRSDVTAEGYDYNLSGPRALVESYLQSNRLGSIDRDTVDGVDCFVLLLEQELPDSTWSSTCPPDAETRIYVDTENLWPVRIDSECGYIYGDKWYPSANSSYGFEWNPEFPDSVFDLSFLDKMEEVSPEEFARIYKRDFFGGADSTYRVRESEH